MDRPLGREARDSGRVRGAAPHVADADPADVQATLAELTAGVCAGDVRRHAADACELAEHVVVFARSEYLPVAADLFKRLRAHHLKFAGDRLIKALGPNRPYAVFSDSLEVYQSDWTGDLLAEFRKRRTVLE